MKIRLAICLLFLNQLAMAGTPGIDDMSIIYGGLLLILVAILGGNFLFKKFKDWRARKAESEEVEEEEDSVG